jgi:hypothetical protein
LLQVIAADDAEVIANPGFEVSTLMELRQYRIAHMGGRSSEDQLSSAVIVAGMDGWTSEKLERRLSHLNQLLCTAPLSFRLTG